MSDSILHHIDARGVASVTLNRPEKHNAFDVPMIDALRAVLASLSSNSAVRAVVLTGAGQTFCSGADLGAMRALIDADEEENLRDALRLTELLAVLNTLPKPTIARVNGNAFGGAVGLIACCDIAIAVRTAKLALTEVRLGIVPAAISPYVLAAIGVRQARRYFQTGELIGAEEARRLGLINEVAESDALDTSVDAVLVPLLKGGPQAQREIKELIREVASCDGAPDEKLRRSTAQRLARLRVSQEGQEGMGAFLEKRAAGWTQPKEKNTERENAKENK